MSKQEPKNEPVSGEIGQKASEMAEQIEQTARDLARVGQEAATLAGGLVRKVAGGLKGKPEDGQAAEGDGGEEVSGQAHEVAEALRKTTEDALRIAQKAVEMASKIAQAPAGGGSKSSQ